MKTVVHRTSFAAPAVGSAAPAVCRGAPPSDGLARSGSGRGGVCVAIVLAALAALAAALMPQPAGASTTTVIYGIAQDNNIYSIDPLTGGVTGTVSTASLGLTGSEANAFALDRDREQVFFLGSNKNLYYWDRPSNSLGQVATAGDLGLDTVPIPRNATFFGDRFWFIGADDNLLRSAAISYTSGLPSGAALQTPVTIAGVPGGLNPNDIAYNPVTQKGYGSNLGGDFFELDISTLLSGTVTYSSLYNAVGVQLAYDKDYSTLYGVAFATGQWYTMDTTVAGTANAISGAVTPEGFRMADLAGGLSAVPVPEPGALALAGSGFFLVGAMLGRSRFRRRQAALPPGADEAPFGDG